MLKLKGIILGFLQAATKRSVPAVLDPGTVMYLSQLVGLVLGVGVLLRHTTRWIKRAFNEAIDKRIKRLNLKEKEEPEDDG